MRAVAAAARGVRAYAWAVAAAALVIAYVLVLRDRPDDGREAVAVTVAVALAAVPPIVLFLFSAALQALAALPRKVRSTPAEGRARADTVARLVTEASRARGLRGTLRVVLLPFRLAREGGEAYALLRPYAPILPLASVPFLVATAVAAIAGVVELAAALVLLLWLAA